MRNLKFIFFLAFFLLFTFNLQAQDFNRLGYTHLKDNWNLYIRKSPEETFKLIKEGKSADFTVSVPNYWNKMLLNTEDSAPETYGCYYYKCTNLDYYINYGIFITNSFIS